MRAFKKAGILSLLAGMMLGCALLLNGCVSISDKRIVRIAHSQSETHPEHLGLLKFKEYIEENLLFVSLFEPKPLLFLQIK